MEGLTSVQARKLWMAISLSPSHVGVVYFPTDNTRSMRQPSDSIFAKGLNLGCGVEEETVRCTR